MCFASNKTKTLSTGTSNKCQHRAPFKIVSATYFKRGWSMIEYVRLSCRNDPNWPTISAQRKHQLLDAVVFTADATRVLLFSVHGKSCYPKVRYLNAHSWNLFFAMRGLPCVQSCATLAFSATLLWSNWMQYLLFNLWTCPSKDRGVTWAGVGNQFEFHQHCFHKLTKNKFMF